MALTNLTGADTITALGQAMSGFQQNVTGVNINGVPVLFGLLLMLLLLGFMAARRASLEVMVIVEFVAAIGFYMAGVAPQIFGLIAVFIGCVIIYLGYRKFTGQ